MVLDITPRANGLTKFGRGFHMHGARDQPEDMGRRMLPDSLHGIRVSMIGRDWEAPHFQAEALGIKDVLAARN